MAIFKSAPETGRTQSAQSSGLRGRISGPIPMDDEFPLRNTGTGVPPDGDGKQAQLSTAGSSNLTWGNAPSDVVREDKTDSVAHSGPSQASNTSGSPRNRKNIRASTVRYSTVSDESATNRQHRKQSTLKAALGRIFGRKKKNANQSFSSGIPSTEPVSSVQHRSEPPPLGPACPKEVEPKRSASLPMTEYGRALRSHSVGPDDMMAIESARNSVQFEFGTLRRRATASSRILSPGINDSSGEMIGLTPRPASTHARGSHLPDDNAPEDIGRAITSDSLTHRRKSRSLSQLHELADHQTDIRRRSAEIRYWQESYDRDHPTESPPQSSRGSQHDFDEASKVDNDSQVESPVEPPAMAFTQPVEFGPTIGLKITEAASAEDRIAALEAQNQKLESLVSQLFEVMPGVNTYTANPLSGKKAPSLTAASSAAAHPSLYRTASDDLQPSSRQSDESFGDGNTFIGSIQPPMIPAQRPTSTATLRCAVREAASLPTLHREVGGGAFSADHYTMLKVLIDTEIAARQALEAQVKKLTHRVNRMSRTSRGPELGMGPTTDTFSTFEHDDDEGDLPTPAYDTYSESEAYKTPEERAAIDFEAVQNGDLHDEEDDISRKRTPRTLSLGQMTLGKHPKAHQEELEPCWRPGVIRKAEELAPQTAVDERCGDPAVAWVRLIATVAVDLAFYLAVVPVQRPQDILTLTKLSVNQSKDAQLYLRYGARLRALRGGQAPICLTRPLNRSGSSRNTLGGWGATLVDSLDALWIMGLHEEFPEAVDAASTIDFTSRSPKEINVFETTIRYLGGFLAACDLSGDQRLLRKGGEVGDMPYVTFDRPNRMPITRWDFQDAVRGGDQVAPEWALVAEVGSLCMELTRLSLITGDPKWFDATERIREVFEAQQGTTKLLDLQACGLSASTLATKDLTMTLHSGAVLATDGDGGEKRGAGCDY
ncbi:hypothetical protein DL769_006173 [Monosporascus sp. CRB-8-3]|nr:hypothetical protein DL769_006173 [Monosporascus sp. CRB-8-3]